MDIDERAIGVWPNVAIDPATGKRYGDAAAGGVGRRDGPEGPSGGKTPTEGDGGAQDGLERPESREEGDGMKWSGETRGEYTVPLADDVWQVHCLGGDPPEPVVRCRDCRHGYILDLSGFHGGSHEHDSLRCPFMRDGVVPEDGFCWKGERE